MAKAKKDVASLLLSDVDRAAIDWIKEQNVQRSDASAISFAVEMQRRRDDDKSYDSDHLYNASVEQIRRSCVKMLSKSKLYGKDENKLTPTSFVRKPDVEQGIESIREKWGFRYGVEAIRFAVRVQAELDGFKPEEGW